jgi:hypothetical protein
MLKFILHVIVNILVALLFLTPFILMAAHHVSRGWPR